jgi:hypothetical protein
MEALRGGWGMVALRGGWKFEERRAVTMFLSEFTDQFWIVVKSLEPDELENPCPHDVSGTTK